MNKYGIDSAKPPVHVGLIAIQLPSIDLGRLFNIGADAAAYYINHHGGFGGAQVVVDKCNSMVTPSVALTCANQVLAQKPLAEYGCEITFSSSGALSLFGKAGVPSFNCTNTVADFTYRWSFGVHPGATGEQGAWARYACTLSNVKKVVLIGQDQAEQRVDSTNAIQPVLKACGKDFGAVYSPVTPTDYTPYVQQALSQKPDFIMLSQSAAQTASILQLLAQNGWPASKVIVLDSSCNPSTTLNLAGSAAEGLLCGFAWKPWDDISIPRSRRTPPR